MVLDAEEGLDDLGDALGRPEFGGKAVLAGPGLEGAFESGQILRLEAGRPAGFGRPLESGLAAFLPGLVPSAGRLAGSAESAATSAGGGSPVK